MMLARLASFFNIHTQRTRNLIEIVDLQSGAFSGRNAYVKTSKGLIEALMNNPKAAHVAEDAVDLIDKTYLTGSAGSAARVAQTLLHTILSSKTNSRVTEDSISERWASYTKKNFASHLMHANSSIQSIVLSGIQNQGSLPFSQRCCKLLLELCKEYDESISPYNKIQAAQYIIKVSNDPNEQKLARELKAANGIETRPELKKAM